MADLDEIQPNFPMEQQQLMEHIKEHVGLRKYIDFMRTIKHILQREQNNVKKGQKRPEGYDKYITNLVNFHYRLDQGKLKGHGKAILGALRTMDLHSSFIQGQIKEFVEDAHVGGSYFDNTDLDDGCMHDPCETMSEGEHDSLNQKYITPINLNQGVQERSRKSKEFKNNCENDSVIQVAEDALHEVHMQLLRNEALVYKLELIVNEREQRKRSKKGGEAQTVKINKVLNKEGERSYYYALNQRLSGKLDPVEKPEKKEPVVFSTLEFSALKDLYGYEKKDKSGKSFEIEERKTVAMDIRESLASKPLKTAKELLPLLEKRHASLQNKKLTLARISNETKRNLLLRSIRRDSESIKQKEYPLLRPRSLLNDYIYLAGWKNQAENCFMAKGDDVWAQIAYENGLVMQFEATRWHKEAFDILRSGSSVAQREKVERFLQIMKTFLGIKFEDGTCTKVREGNFVGLLLYGGHWLYTAIRLYHVLLVRLYTSHLYAEIDHADYEFRKHCDKVGKRRLEAIRPDAYNSEAVKMREQCGNMKLPPSEGTAEEKSARFVEAVKKRERTGGNGYMATDFEADVMWAVGEKGNLLFTMPRLLTRIREAITAVDVGCFDAFDMHCTWIRSGAEAGSRYEEEALALGDGWFFKFQCLYSDSFVDDEWTSVGERGDVGRVRAMAVRKGDMPEEEDAEKTGGKKKGKRGGTKARGNSAKRRRL